METINKINETEIEITTDSVVLPPVVKISTKDEILYNIEVLNREYTTLLESKETEISYWTNLLNEVEKMGIVTKAEFELSTTVEKDSITEDKNIV